MLPHTTYEIIRWAIAIVLPALGLFLITINDIWHLDWPASEISLTLDALGLFLGTVFGISKVTNDIKNNKKGVKHDESK